MHWNNSIVGHDTIDPHLVQPNDLNWRTHPSTQANALSDALDEVGWVQSIVINQSTGRLLDGHLRLKLALQNNEPLVPVTYVQLTEEQERKALLTLDPIGAMATTNQDILNQLIATTQTESIVLTDLFESLKKASNTALETALETDAVSPSPSAGSTESNNYHEQYGVVVICQNEHHQQEVYEQLQADGYENLKVVTT